jgi:anti-sigma factor RsiW
MSDEKTTPTDLELMLWADGELTGEEHERVAAYVAGDETAQAKLAAMGLVGDLLREEAQGATGADDLADLVMGRLEAEAPPEKLAPVLPLRPAAPARRRTHRGAWTLAVAAVAAAAGLLLWSRGPAPIEGGLASISTTTHQTPAPPAEAERGVEVAAIDTGEHAGAIFYVPSDSAQASDTAVVWITADSSGGNE